MKILEYSKDHSRQTLEKWRTDHEGIELNEDYSTIRSDLQTLYTKAREIATGTSRIEYMTDVLFGLSLYDYFSKKEWFNLRTAANDGFWRYISVAVIPGIVADRWGSSKDNYYWKQSNRLWPKTAWWYIYLTWNESHEKTQDMLTSDMFNSDTIQGIVERTGKKGTFVEVYREIIRQYSLLDNNVISKFKKQRAKGSESLFRAIMKLNTAKGLVTDPCLFKDGIQGYVQSLITDLTNNLK